MTWFGSVLRDRGFEAGDTDPAEYAGAVADNAVLDSFTAAMDRGGLVEGAIPTARELGDPALLARTLTAGGCIAGLDFDLAAGYFADAIGLARMTGDDWRLSQILGRQAYLAAMAGDPVTATALAAEGADVADALDDWANAHTCRWAGGVAQMFRANLDSVIDTFAARRYRLQNRQRRCGHHAVSDQPGLCPGLSGRHPRGQKCWQGGDHDRSSSTTCWNARPRPCWPWSPWVTEKWRRRADSALRCGSCRRCSEARCQSPPSRCARTPTVT